MSELHSSVRNTELGEVLKLAKPVLREAYLGIINLNFTKSSYTVPQTTLISKLRSTIQIKSGIPLVENCTQKAVYRIGCQAAKMMHVE